MQRIAIGVHCKGLVLMHLIFFASGAVAQVNLSEISDKYPIIPNPQELEYGNRELIFDALQMTHNEFEKEGLQPKKVLVGHGLWSGAKMLDLKIVRDGSVRNLKGEGYALVVDDGITIAAPTAKGAYYGLQTVRQLLRNKDGRWTLPQVDVRDRPVFEIRGFLHDTGRNFQSIDQLKEQIDVLALYKYNIFHWHLTDYPGWRLESKIYPELQTTGTFSRHIGKYYGQDDFKEILAYCKERYITVIPEFDIPGHTDAFRKAFGFTSMKDERVLPILLDLFDELLGLAGPDEMPYIHIGTDEVRNEAEYVEDDLIPTLMEHIHKKGREVIVWKEGIKIKDDTTSINQLWAQFEGKKGHRFIDSRSNYINHMDPFSGMARLFFQQPCRQPEGDSLALGGILCAWPDNNVGEERDILRQNPIYPAIVFYSDAIWRGRQRNQLEYWAKLPMIGDPDLERFKDFETKVLAHKDLFFKGKEFPYIKQTEISWKVIGPFDHKGDFTTAFPMEKKLKKSYRVNGKSYAWEDAPTGATVHLKHFFGFPALTDEKAGTYYAYTRIYSPDAREQPFWIGFHGWSRAGGRRGGPAPKHGQWHTTDPKVRVNDREIPPPIWRQPGLGVATDEIPFVDEDYFYRPPTPVSLKKGWNTVLLKIPHGGTSWKWMFTCIPVSFEDGGVREAKDLIFDASF